MTGPWEALRPEGYDTLEEFEAATEAYRFGYEKGSELGRRLQQEVSEEPDIMGIVMRTLASLGIDEIEDLDDLRDNDLAYDPLTGEYDPERVGGDDEEAPIVREDDPEVFTPPPPPGCCMDATEGEDEGVDEAAQEVPWHSNPIPSANNTFREALENDLKEIGSAVVAASEALDEAYKRLCDTKDAQEAASKALVELILAIR
jgi:hypothetical protein